MHFIWSLKLYYNTDKGVESGLTILNYKSPNAYICSTLGTANLEIINTPGFWIKYNLIHFSKSAVPTLHFHPHRLPRQTAAVTISNAYSNDDQTSPLIPYPKFRRTGTLLENWASLVYNLSTKLKKKKSNHAPCTPSRTNLVMNYQ